MRHLLTWKILTNFFTNLWKIKRVQPLFVSCLGEKRAQLSSLPSQLRPGCVDVHQRETERLRVIPTEDTMPKTQVAEVLIWSTVSEFKRRKERRYSNQAESVPRPFIIKTDVQLRRIVTELCCKHSQMKNKN